MRDLGQGAGGSGGAAVLPSADEITSWARSLDASGRHLDDAQRIDLLRALEELKCAAAGAQAEVTADFVISQRAQAQERGVPAARRDRGIALQVALAKRESHHRGQRDVALAMTLRKELQCTARALRHGRITEWRAVLIARESACLSLAHRHLVDEAVAGDLDKLEGMGDRETAAFVTDMAERLDAASVVERRRRAEADRHTSLRPAPDVMTWFGALLPVRHGVAVHKALLDEAHRKRAAGDKRSVGALMADTLVERVVRPAVAAVAGGPALMINIVVPDTVLLGDADGSGFVEGYGDVPGDLLREWIASNAEDGVADWVRRLYARPKTTELVAMDRRGRPFGRKLAEFLRLRDRRCRNRWCNAPIRHLDHADDVAKGGATSAGNGQGLCEACNYAKQADGWSAREVTGANVHTIEIITPTGHRYLSTVPATGPPGWMTLYPDSVRVEATDDWSLTG
jgi:Domain of unknown function (DUF222)